MTLAEYRKKMAEEFNKLVDEARHSPRAGQTFRDSLEPNPNGYNVAQIIGISMGNGHMFSKNSKEHQ